MRPQHPPSRRNRSARNTAALAGPEETRSPIAGDNSIFGSIPAEQNNGFSRDGKGMPTQDAERPIDFLTEELAYRGYTPDDFAE